MTSTPSSACRAGGSPRTWRNIQGIHEAPVRFIDEARLYGCHLDRHGDSMLPNDAGGSSWKWSRNPLALSDSASSLSQER